MSLDGAEGDLYQAARKYTKCGIIVHPLYRGDEKSKKCRSPGKQPILPKWQILNTPLDDGKLKRYFQVEQRNIGAVCGKDSDLTVLDVDWEVSGIWVDIYQGVDKTGWIKQQRTEGKYHYLFKYSDKINRAIRQELGFDLLNNKSNIVLAPSVHPEGQTYKMIGDIADRPEMPDIVADRIKEKLELYDDLSTSVSNCRHPFRGLWDAVFVLKKHPHYHKTSIFRAADGRDRTLALFAELKRNGATDEELRLVSQLIFGDQYNEEVSRYQISKIDPECTAKTETIKADRILNEFFDPIIARGENKTRAKSKGKKTEENKDKEKENKLSDIDRDEIDIPDDQKEAARLEAIDILKNRDPIGYISDTIQERHVGDKETEECICVSIAGQSCLNTDGIQTSVNGDSGSGKSHLMKIHLHLVPERYKEVTSLSPKAAYYMELKPGTIIFSDDTTPSEEMEDVIKRATTNYQEYTKHTIVRDGKRQNFRIPPRINWYLTSVDSEVSTQLLNRQLTFNTITSEAHKNSIFEKQQDMAEKGEMPVIDVNYRVLVCRRIYDIIKSQTFKVKIPYAKEIKIQDKSDSRVFPMILDMIKGYTIFFHMQRETDDEGYLLATIDDFKKAKKLFESQTEGILSKLNEKERKILAVIIGNKRCDIQNIAQKTKYSYSTVRNVLKGRQKSKSAGEGLLAKVPGLSISYETHTTNEEGDYKISKRAEYFVLSSEYNRWELYQNNFITLDSERD